MMIATSNLPKDHPGVPRRDGRVAAYMGIRTEELLMMNKATYLTAEDAGTGFAAEVALSSKYHGKEISSVPVLKDLGVEPTELAEEPPRLCVDNGKGERMY